eukprot:gene303-biopygen312
MPEDTLTGVLNPCVSPSHVAANLSCMPSRMPTPNSVWFDSAPNGTSSSCRAPHRFTTVQQPASTADTSTTEIVIIASKTLKSLPEGYSDRQMNFSSKLVATCCCVRFKYPKRFQTLSPPTPVNATGSPYG